MSRERPVGPGRHPSASRRPNAIAVLTPGGPVVVIVNSRKTRGEIARHLNAVRRYLEIGDDRKLREFEDAFLELEGGRRLEFVTDLATLDRLAEAGEVHFELYRR